MSGHLFELLSRVGGAALVRATLGLVLCLALALSAERSAEVCFQPWPWSIPCWVR